ncbi:MAG TPA: hypothetical protein VEI97_15245, partial [bacterium]|nr:hypothetical protein [bacterium]
MSEGQLPLFKGLPEPQPELPSPAVGRPEPLTLRLGDLPATYGSPEVEAGPSKRTLLMGAGGLVLAVAIGVGIGLQPLLQRRQMVVGLERQIAAGNITAAQTTLDRFAAAYPDHPAMLRYKGLVALGQAKWPEAREHLEAQVKREEKDPAANRGLGYLYGLAQIYQQVPPAEADLRKAMIQDWTHLFEYNVAGVDPAAPGLGTSIVSPASEAQKALGRLRAVG